MQEQSLIQLPDYWDKEKVLNAFKTMSTLELYKYFGCANSTSFTRMMKPIFPNRPDKMSYSTYVLKCIEEGLLDTPKKKVAWTIGTKDDEYN